MIVEKVIELIEELNTFLITSQNFNTSGINYIINKIFNLEVAIENAIYFQIPNINFHLNVKNKKIAIIGAGASGLIAAYELKKKGYRVTIYEKSERIGGKTNTTNFNGYNVDSTTVWLTGSYQRLWHLLREFGVHTYKNNNAFMYIDDKQLITSELIKGEEINVYIAILKYITIWFRFYIENLNFRFLNNKIDVGGRKYYSLTLNEFIEKENLEVIREILYVAITLQGYAIPDKVPMFYAFTWLRPLMIFGALLPINDTSEVIEGWNTLWENMAKTTDIIFNANIKSISSTDTEACLIYQKHGKNINKKFDAIVVTPNLGQITNILNIPRSIKNIFNKIKYTRYNTALVEYDSTVIDLGNRGYFLDDVLERKNFGKNGNISGYKNSVKPNSSSQKRKKYITLGSVDEDSNNNKIEDFKVNVNKFIDSKKFIKGGKILYYTSTPYLGYYDVNDIKNNLQEKLYKNRRYKNIFFTSSDFTHESLSAIPDYAFVFAKEIDNHICNSNNTILTLTNLLDF